MRSASVINGLLFALLSVLLAGAPAKATTYDEGISGDLSNSQSAPTPLTLTLGSNAVIGSVNGSTDSQDWISFTIPTGFVMASFVNAAYSSTDAQGFTGFQFGSAFVGSPFTQGTYAGYAHFGTGATNPSPPATTVGVDLLPLMANPSVAAGATGFTAPLAAGTYTFLIQQLGAPTNYEFDMTVSAVPEPTSLCLFGVGSLGILLGVASRRKRFRTIARRTSLTLIALLCIGLGPAFGQLDGTTTLSGVATISAIPNGPNFDYTISLTNTGSSNIGTLWFAWTPPLMPIEYDLLPSLPSSISQPTGWIGGPSSNGIGGYSIEYYNLSGSLVGPGQTDMFHFTSPDSPTTLQGFSFGFPITTSFIYSGLPESGPTAQVSPVFVPEPSTYALLAVGCAGLLALRRRTAASYST